MPYVLIASLLLFLSTIAAGHYPPWLTFIQESLAALGGLCFCCSVAVTQRRAIQLPVAGGVWGTIGTLVVVRVASQSGFYVEDLALLTFYFGVGFVCLISAANALDSRSFSNGIFAALAGGGMVSVLLQLFQWQSLPWLGVLLTDMPPGGRPYANLAQPNHVATLHCLGLIGIWFFRQQGLLTRWAAALLAGWLLLGLVMTQSRTGAIAAVIALLTWAVVSAPRLGRGAMLRYVAGWLLLAGLMQCVWLGVNDLLLNTDEKLAATRVTAGTRSVYWPVMLRATLVHPWIGWGWDHIAAAQQWMGRQAYAGGEQLQSAHNIVLDLALAIGWPAALAVSAMSVGWLWHRRRVHVAHEQAAWVAIVVMIVHAATEYPLRYLYFLVPLTMFVGVLSRKEIAGHVFHKGGTNRSWWMWSVGYAAAVIVFGSVGGRLASEYWDIEEAERLDRFALAGFAQPASQSVSVPATLLLDGWQDMHRFRFTQARSDMSANDIAQMKRVADRWPYPPVVFRYALALALNAQVGESQFVLRGLCGTQSALLCEDAAKSWQQAADRYPGLPAFPLPTPGTPPARSDP